MSQQKKRKTTHSVTDSDNVKDDEHWTDGDFELISSNNVRFRVPSYYLLAHSSVFRDTLSVGNGEKRIEFTDCEIERASTIRRFLQIASNGGLEDCMTGPIAVHLLVRFLQKYDCPGALRIVLAQLSDSCRDFNKQNPLSIFVAGAMVDDEQTCLVVLSQRQFQWTRTTPGTTSAIYGRSIFDPNAFPMCVFTALPPKYCWALTRAYDVAGDTEQLPIEFSKYLAAAKNWEEMGAFSQYYGRR